MSRLLRYAISLLVAVLASHPAEARRVALVVGNSSYTGTSSLANPAADARLVAASLKKAGFDTVDLKFDLGKSALESALRDFGLKADGADVALIYYAGHGIEAGGQNYLIPTDARLARDRDLDIEATRLETVMLMAESARLRIVILDACRNNPFVSSMQRTFKTRSVGRGLAVVEPEGETLVVYAAKAGATAADGAGANSPFAEALAKRLPEPGLEISLLFRAVRDDVLSKTGRTQEPFTYGSLSGQAFYFTPPPAPTIAVASSAPVQISAPPVQPSVSSEATEILFWQGAVSANTEAAYRDYLNRYPSGMFAGLAGENMRRFVPQQETAPAAAAPGRAQTLRQGGGPSFNCGARLNRIEQMICKSPALATADRNFGERFITKHKSLGADERLGLVRWAAENRRKRDQCQNAGCVLNWYQRMTNGLQGF